MRQGRPEAERQAQNTSHNPEIDSSYLVWCAVEDVYSACSYTPRGCACFLDLHNELAYLNMRTQNITYNKRILRDWVQLL